MFSRSQKQTSSESGNRITRPSPRAWFWGIGALLVVGLGVGCEFLVTFETIPEGGGGHGGSTTGGGGGAPCTLACCSAADCTPPTDPCREADCTEGTCGEKDRDEGSDAGSQTAGDCLKNVCVGGVQMPVPDDTDPLDDANECTTDLCDSGAPTVTPAESGAACSIGGVVCNGLGNCVECVGDGNCPPEAQICVLTDFKCVPLECINLTQDGAETDVDCGGGVCATCDVGKMCSTDTDCFTGICGLDLLCAAPTCDDGKQNGAETDIDCGAVCPILCGPSQGCNDPGDCLGGECTGTGGTCIPNCADATVNNDESDVDCGGSSCVACADGLNCAGVDANCASGKCGPQGVCLPAELGQPCSGADPCEDAFCEDGVCCLTPCNEICQSCALPGSEGVCTNIADGEDPDDECFGACNGLGACGTNPTGSSCSANEECESSFCVDQYCCDQSCTAICEACNVDGKFGFCFPIPAGTDPDQECVSGTCNGMGLCE